MARRSLVGRALSSLPNYEKGKIERKRYLGLMSSLKRAGDFGSDNVVMETAESVKKEDSSIFRAIMMLCAE